MCARQAVRVALLPKQKPGPELRFIALLIALLYCVTFFTSFFFPIVLTAFLVFLLTLTLVIWQPRGLGIGWSASLGAVLALLLGVIHVADIPVVWHIVWNATGTFIAIIVISLILDQAGFFEWAALHVARWGGGHGRKL